MIIFELASKIIAQYKSEKRLIKENKYSERKILKKYKITKESIEKNVRDEFVYFRMMTYISPLASFKDKLKKHRKLKGYSVEELALITCIDKKYLHKLENEDLPNVPFNKILRITNMLDITLDYLLSKEECLEDIHYRSILGDKK